MNQIKISNQIKIIKKIKCANIIYNQSSIKNSINKNLEFKLI